MPTKPCPICNTRNEDDAPACTQCGNPLEPISTKFVGMPDPADTVKVEKIESFIDLEWIPENGIGIQVAGQSMPIYAPVRTELVIGRTTGYTPPADDFLDLSHLNAVDMGVSRKHLTIKRTASGYEVIDLASRNGSWLNGKRLVPNRPYPLSSGSIIRIGSMHFLVKYRPAK